MKMRSLVVTFYIITFLQLNCQFIDGEHENPSDFGSESEDEGFCTIDQKDSCLLENKESKQLDSDCFRVAVVEYQRIDYSDIVKTAETNLKIFSQIAEKAKENDVKLIVFPEDGLFLGTKESVVSVLNEIPDPFSLNDDINNPCDHSKKYNDSDILVKLSCIAKENNLYLIANLGTRQTCKPLEIVEDRQCPERGFLALNTNVVFNPDGTFIRRYRKYNMFIEIFDKAPSLETVYFDTPHGRFGVFTCFDLLFKAPAMKLIDEYKIDTAIFPTWWYDELPLLSALQTQHGWSDMNKVNMLAANIHRKSLGSTGSSIISLNETLYTGANENHSKLLIANLHGKNYSKKCKFDPMVVKLETSLPPEEYVYKHYELVDTDELHILDKFEDERTLCSNQFCCTIEYKIRKDSGQTEDGLNKMIVIARDGLRPGSLNWYEQVCVLATLKNPIDRQHLNVTTYSKSGLFEFERLNLKATFSSNYVFPVAAYDVSSLIKRHGQNFRCSLESDNYSCELDYLISTKSGENARAIYAFGMYGRLFESDKMPEGW